MSPTNIVQGFFVRSGSSRMRSSMKNSIFSRLGTVNSNPLPKRLLMVLA